MQSFIQDIIGEIPKLTERKVYRLFCSIKQRHNKYGIFGLGKRDGFRFGISCRQMQYFVNLMIDYGFINEVKKVMGGRGFYCRVFSISKELKGYLNQIKDYVKKTFEYINPTEYVKARFTYKETVSRITFKINGEKYIIHKQGKFKDVIYYTMGGDKGKIINPLELGKCTI